MRSLRLKFMFVWLAMAALLLAACGTDDTSTPDSAGDDPTAGGAQDGDMADGEPIKIGSVIPLSGPFAAPGQEILRGYQIAIEEFGGSVAGRPIELVRGDGMSPDDVIAEVDRLATRENVDFFVATYASPASEAGSEAATRHGKFWYETHATADGLTDRGLENYVRGTLRGLEFGEGSANFILEEVAPGLGVEPEDLTVFIDYVDNSYGEFVSESQERVLTEAGVNLTVAAHAGDATDVTDSVLAARRAEPDVWLITGYVPDSNLLQRTAAEQGFDPPAIVLTGAGDSQETFEAVGPEVIEDVFVVAYPHWPEDQIEVYRSRFNADPIDTVSYTAWTGMTAALKLLELSGGATDTASLRQAAAEVDIPMGGLPNGWGLKFDENGQNTRLLVTAVQWTAAGETPTVWPADRAEKGVTGLGS